MLIVALAAGLLTQFFPCCAFAIRSFSKVNATPDHGVGSLAAGADQSLGLCYKDSDPSGQS